MTHSLLHHRCLVLILLSLSPMLLHAAPLKILVDNVEVTKDNADNVLRGEGAGRDGCVSFNYANHTLTLRNAKLTHRITITGETPDQLTTVRLEGENEIITRSWAFWIFTPVIIEGPGSLLIRSTGRYARGFTLNGEQPELYLKIRNTDVRVEAGTDGEALFSPNVREGYVVLENTHFYSEGLVGGMKEIYLQGCEIINADEVYLAYRDDGCAVVGTVKGDNYNYGPLDIKPNDHYPLALGETQVTRTNASDIFAGKGQSGVARYDFETNTLRLNNLKLNAGEENGIFSRFCPLDKTLTIELTGENSIESEYSGLLLFGNTCIKGTGSLNITAWDNTQDFAGIFISEDDTLTIRDCNISCSGPFGIAGIRRHSKLIIDGAALDIRCTRPRQGAVIEGFDLLALHNASITAPEGAHFDPYLYGVTVDGHDLCNEFVQIARGNRTVSIRTGQPLAYATPGVLHISEAGSLTPMLVYSAEGTLLYAASASGEKSVQLPSGKYLVHIGDMKQIVLIP